MGAGAGGAGGAGGFLDFAKSSGGGALLSGGAQALGTIAVGIMNHDENRRMRKVAEGQLQLAKDQFTEEKNKYATTMKNQGEAISTLGDSFGKALQKESSTPTLSQGSDSMASFAKSPAQSTTQDSSPQAEQEKKEQPLPTERM